MGLNGTERGGEEKNTQGGYKSDVVEGKIWPARKKENVGKKGSRKGQRQRKGCREFNETKTKLEKEKKSCSREMKRKTAGSNLKNGTKTT